MTILIWLNFHSKAFLNMCALYMYSVSTGLRFDHYVNMFRGSKSGQSSSRQLTTRPEAMSMDFIVRPQSKIDPDEIRARAKQVVRDERRVKVGFLPNLELLSCASYLSM